MRFLIEVTDSRNNQLVVLSPKRDFKDEGEANSWYRENFYIEKTLWKVYPVPTKRYKVAYNEVTRHTFVINAYDETEAKEKLDKFIETGSGICAYEVISVNEERW